MQIAYYTGLRIGEVSGLGMAGHQTLGQYLPSPEYAFTMPPATRWKSVATKRKKNPYSDFCGHCRDTKKSQKATAQRAVSSVAKCISAITIQKLMEKEGRIMICILLQSTERYRTIRRTVFCMFTSGWFL